MTAALALLIVGCGPDSSPLGTKLERAEGQHPGEVTSINVAPQGEIAFESRRDGNPEVYRINADGTAEANLTNNPASEFSPQYSPDGTRLTFASNRDGNSEIYVMNSDGSGQTNLTNHPSGDFEPRWSPDATKIVFHSTRTGAGATEVFVMNADGTGQTNLTNHGAADFRARWSPDGTRILFLTTRDGNVEVYVMNADGSTPRNLSNHPAEDSYSTTSEAVWSPDGSKVAFHSYRTGDVYVVNADGTELSNLTNTRYDDRLPEWSPDGTKIAFQTYRSGPPQIFTMNPDGTGLLNVTKNAVEVFRGGRWSPDGKKLAFQSPLGDIFVINADGTGLKRLTTDGNNGLPVWNPVASISLIQVEIDIKPGSNPNSINCTSSEAVIPVAILTTPGFDATTVDHTTVSFEGATETHLDRKTGLPRRHEEDVDGDGDTDLVSHFRYGDTGLDCFSTEGTLSGETFEGIQIQGTDAVTMVGG
jgi:Tol biopolymer transport system component